MLYQQDAKHHEVLQIQFIFFFLMFALIFLIPHWTLGLPDFQKCTGLVALPHPAITRL